MLEPDDDCCDKFMAPIAESFQQYLEKTYKVKYDDEEF